MASAEAERKVFEQFAAVLPNFAGRLVKCAAGPNPPDFICTDADGRRIGVELSEWLDETQIAQERPQYQREEVFLKAIRSRDERPPHNIGNIWIFEKEGARLEASVASSLNPPVA